MASICMAPLLEDRAPAGNRPGDRCLIDRGRPLNLRPMKQTLAAMTGIMLALAADAAVPQIPVETLFGTNYIRSAVLSPDGTKVAFLAPSGGTYGLALLDLATHKVTNPVHIEDENIDSIA